MSKQPDTRGICRIDQPSHRTHGFFVRIQRGGKIYSAFFTDKRWGGKSLALAAAQGYHRELAAKFGTPVHQSRRWWAELPRRKNQSGIIGVRRVVNRKRKVPQISWSATWSPKPYVSVKKSFSVKKFGEKMAKLMAIHARRAGVRDMEE